MKLKAFLVGVALAGGVAFVAADSANAAPAQSTLPALQGISGTGVTQARRRCVRVCERRRWGRCVRWRTRCRG